jgi:hypothetical protein
MLSAAAAEETRATLAAMAADAQAALAVLKASPSAQVVRAQTGQSLAELTADLDVAQARIASMSVEELNAYQDVFDQYPIARDIPRRVRQFVEDPGIRRALMETPVTPANISADCNAGPGTPLGYVDISISRSVVFAAKMALDVVPLFSPAKNVLYAVKFGIATFILGPADVASQSIEGTWQLWTECNAAKSGKHTRDNIEALILTTPSRGADYVAEATQLETGRADLSARIDTLSTDFARQMDAVGDTTETRAEAVQQTVESRLTTLNTDVVNRIASADQAVQARRGVVSNTIAVNRALQLRIYIETSLSQAVANERIARFQLPASQGGYLEQVRDIATETVTKYKAAGQLTAQAEGRARNLIASGNTAFGAGRYKVAFANYRSAYQETVKP